ncbi:MAG: hypothetical protein H0Z31_00920 [Bacillus sp. (in: Bacteria)]|nr:hypothetical protein [Bacillus sp. (in: firmicutes)]
MNIEFLFDAPELMVTIHMCYVISLFWLLHIWKSSSSFQVHSDAWPITIETRSGRILEQFVWPSGWMLPFLVQTVKKKEGVDNESDCVFLLAN